MKSHVARLTAIALALTLGVLPGVAYAQSEEHGHEGTTEHPVAAGAEHGEAHSEHEEHEHENRFHVGLLGTMLVSLSEEGTELQHGGGLLFAWAVVPEHFEIELIPHMMLVKEGFEAPVDLLAVVPIPISHIVEPYVAVGGTLVPFSIGQESGLRYGLAAAAGAHFWFNHHAGLLVEFNYNAVWASTGALAHEFGGSIGPVVAF